MCIRDRKYFKIPCRYIVDGRTRRGMVSNLSTGGTYIREASEIPALGTEISVTLLLSPGYNCRLRALVVHTQSGVRAFGVDFLNPLRHEPADPSLMELLA